jgi:chromosome segregation protein
MTLEAARAAAQAARTEDSAARAEAARCEEQLTSLEGKVNALEGLERERVGLAPAAARLLRDRERFGDAILGPLSDFLTASADSASLVERYLGMTVHAVVVHDRATADEIRQWHAEHNPGPLLLLPLDSVPPQSSDDQGDLVAERRAMGECTSGTCQNAG